MTTATTRRRRPATDEQLRRSGIAAAQLGAALPATITEANGRRFEHVTGIVPAGDPAAVDLGLSAGDAIAPAVLVIDRPGAMTCYVAVELAGATLELELL